MSYQTNSRGIRCLLQHSGPSAICRPIVFYAFLAVAATVVSIIVLPIDAVPSAWASSDISLKRIEGRTPTLAYSNTSAAVVFVQPAVRVAASLKHGRPDCIYTSLARPCLSVNCACLGYHLSREASATHSVSVGECILLRDGSVTTVADAVPESMMSSSSKGHDEKSPKSLSCKIDRVTSLDCWLCDKICLSHDVNLLNRFASGQSRAMFQHRSRLASLYANHDILK